MANPVQQSHLLRLPVELRLQIYGYVFGKQATRVFTCYFTTGGAYFEPKRSYYPAISTGDETYPDITLLQTCRQLHDEAVWFLGSRQTLRLYCYWWHRSDPSSRFALLNKLTIPEHCVRAKIKVVFFVPASSAGFPLQRARNAPAMLRAFLQKANIKKIIQIRIYSYDMAITEDWSYELTRHIPALGTSVEVSASSRVLEPPHNFREHKSSTASLLATIHTIEKYRRVVRDLAQPRRLRATGYLRSLSMA